MSLPRGCINARTGQVKVVYDVQLEAELVAVAHTLLNRRGPPVHAYRCEHHGGWHVGREPGWYSRRWMIHPTVGEELGPRAWNCLIRENCRDRTFRVRLLTHLARVAAQRRGEDPYGERNRSS